MDGVLCIFAERGALWLPNMGMTIFFWLKIQQCASLAMRGMDGLRDYEPPSRLLWPGRAVRPYSVYIWLKMGKTNWTSGRRRAGGRAREEGEMVQKVFLPSLGGSVGRRGCRGINDDS